MISEDRRGWHLDKGISISTLMTMGAYTLGLIVWGLTIEKRVDMNSYVIQQISEQQRELIQQQKKQHERDLDYMQRIHEELRRLNGKPTSRD